MQRAHVLVNQPTTHANPAEGGLQARLPGDQRHIDQRLRRAQITIQPGQRGVGEGFGV
ncbi:hypothetical protein ALP75_200086 [Pseudomonas syringae pv. actinidiae]|nr:hypothetical protein ALP75_200086 [Pseudomonas syringae pv. actinidiae]